MSCPYIPELAYGEFSERLQRKIGEQRVPIAGSLELTMRCNLRCQHCYLEHDANGSTLPQELSLDEIKRILDGIVDQGTLWLLLTGGEPLLRKDFSDIYLYAKRKGLILTLFTNGTLLTPRIADFLAEWRPFIVEISLYGSTQKTYERVTGMPAAYKQTMRGIEMLLERNIPLKLKTVLMTLNQHELAEMQAFAESLGVGFRFDSMLNGSFGANQRPLELRLNPEEVISLDLADPARMEGWRQFNERSLEKKYDSGALYQCGAGMRTYHIDSYGQLSLCLLSRAQSYDLRQGTFREGWEQFLLQQRIQPPPPNYACNRCELISLCGQCPGWAYLEHGNPGQNVDYLCQVAHLRAKTFDFVRSES